MTRGVTLFVQRLALVAILFAAPYAVERACAGSFTGVGNLGGNYSSPIWPSPLSADGSAVVGFSGTASGNDHAFRWTSASGITDLGVLPGGDSYNIYATAVSADGSVVVGYSYTASGYHAFRWTSSGMTDLG